MAQTQAEGGAHFTFPDLYSTLVQLKKRIKKGKSLKKIVQYSNSGSIIEDLLKQDFSKPSLKSNSQRLFTRTQVDRQRMKQDAIRQSVHTIQAMEDLTEQAQQRRQSSAQKSRFTRSQSQNLRMFQAGAVPPTVQDRPPLRRQKSILKQTQFQSKSSSKKRIRFEDEVEDT